MSQYSTLAAFYDEVFPYRPAVLEFLAELLPDSAAGASPSILDVGCGPGHYAGHLAQRGYQAEGLDLDPEMVRLARQRYSDVSFRVADMRAMGLPTDQYQLIFCLGNTAAHLTRDEFRAFVDDVFHSLAPGGVWVVQLINWDQLLQETEVTFPPRVIASAGLTFSRRFTEITQDKALFKPRLEREGELLFAEDVQLHPLPGEWLRGVHEAVGFERAGHYGDYDRSAFDPAASPASVFVGRRPTSS